jgi:CheY-like chemotaxis protein
LLPRLFESFTQGEQSQKRGRGGLGLGLALVNGLVELHSGAVSAESDGPGRGARFTVSLPLAPEIPDSELPPSTATHEPGAWRVLLVEDNRDAAESLRDLLELVGCTVEVAASGPEALAAAPRFRPEIVLCDLGLPGMDGYEVATELRRHPVIRDASLIAVSGYGQEEDRRRSQAAGFGRHLTKPIDFAELQQLLELAPGERAESWRRRGDDGASAA